VSFAALILCVDSQRVRPKVSVYFVIDSVRKLLDTPSYISTCACVAQPLIIAIGEVVSLLN
jgi:hypothetical protein